MTRFFMDEKEIAPLPDSYSLDQILRHVENAYLPPDSVVREIRLDGHTVTPAVLPEGSGWTRRGIEETETVEIYTGTVGEVAYESAIEALEYLDRVEAIIPSLATSFQVSPEPESFKSLRQLCEGYYWLNLLLDNLEKSLHISLEDLTIRDLSVGEYLQKFVAALKQLIESQERGDFKRISDILRDEIIPLGPIWKELFSQVAVKTAIPQ